MGKEGVKGRKEARKVVLLLLSTVFLWSPGEECLVVFFNH